MESDNMETIAYITHPDCLLHQMGEGHPERPARLKAMAELLSGSDLESLIRRYEAPLIDQNLLEAVHSSSYVHDIFSHAPVQGVRYLDADTSMMPHSLTAARRAAGAVIQAIDLVMSGEVNSAFCAVRPPGHHAEQARAMGFCIFNNIAAGASYALNRYGLKRVAIIDFDVHHGNGTEDIFKEDPRVLFCSSFQHPFYPYSGADTRNDHIINIPLQAGAGSKLFREQVEQRWLPALNGFQPELMMISAGFDAHTEEIMAGLNLVEEDYYWITAQLKAIAETSAAGRIVSSLEGGYALDALARSLLAHLSALGGLPSPMASSSD